MRRSYLLVSLFFMLILSCKKDNTAGNTPPPPPPGGGTGGTGNVTITNISPLTPYGGDVITVTGTGFSTDKTKDSIYFGYIAGSVFNLGGTAGHVKATILNATATQIQFVTDSALPISYIDVGIKAALTVHTTNGVANSDNVMDFRLPLVWGLSPTGPGYTNCFSVFADDSFSLNGTGLYPPLTVSIEGKSLPGVVADNNNGLSARGYIPIDYYGHTDPLGDCNGSKFYTVKVVNGDGKVYSRQMYVFEGPASRIDFLTLNQVNYSLSADNQAIVHVTGYALRDDYNVIVRTYDNSDKSTTVKIISLGVGNNFPNSTDLAIDLHALPTPKSNDGMIVSFGIFAGPTPPDNYGYGNGFTVFN